MCLTSCNGYAERFHDAESYDALELQSAFAPMTSYIKYQIIESVLSFFQQKGCVGTLAPSVARLFPNQTVVLNIRLASAPVLAITNQTIKANAELQVSDQMPEMDKYWQR